jgi:imidazolonepropionase-like amidohydrolase
MDGKNYKAAVSLHKEQVNETVIRNHFQTWRDAGITFVRDGGDAAGVSARAKELAAEYGIDYRSPLYAIHKRGHYGGIVGLGFSDWKEYSQLVRNAKRQGADFIKLMISGLVDFSEFGRLTEEGLGEDEIRTMISIAHEEGMTVMIHGNGDRQVRAAVEAGAETLEHGNYVSRETLDCLAESRTVWVPTFAPIGNLIGCGRFPDEAVEQILKQHMENVAYAFGKGALIGLGSDSGAYRVPHGQGLLDEYAYMRRALAEVPEQTADGRLKEAEERIYNSSRQK